MRTSTRMLVACGLLLGVLALGGCRAQGTPEPSPNNPSSAGLVERPKSYDGTEVEFTGEVIGEVMVRGDYAWLHINDDPYYLKNVEEGAQLGGYNTGMPVWLAADLTEQIANYGDYKHEGDVVKVVGTFNAACAEHGGDMDIHARQLTIATVGHTVVDPIHPEKTLWAVGLSLLALAFYLLNRNWDHISERLQR